MAKLKGLTTSLTFNDSNTEIKGATSDGSDNASFTISASDNDVTRGGFITVYGNEASGQVLISSGDVAGSAIDLKTAGLHDIKFTTNNLLRWSIVGSGNLEPNGTVNIGNISSPNLVNSVNAITFQAANQDMFVGTTTTHNLNFKTAASTKWKITSSGNLEPENDVSYAIGSSTKALSEIWVNDIKGRNGYDVGIYTQTGRPVRFFLGGINRWTFDGGGDLISHTSNTALAIRSNTSDGSDNGVLYICGGGSFSDTRGAYIELFGNEQATAGRLSLVSGNAGDVKLFTANQILFEAGGTSRWKILSDGTLESTAGHSIYSNRYETNTSVELNSGSATDQVRFAQGGNLRWYIDAAGAFVSNGVFDFNTTGDIYTKSAHFTGSIICTDTSGTIRLNTADGTDTGSLFLSGGGAYGSTRGAFIQLTGNESGDTGGIHIGAGNVSGGDIRFDTGGSTRWTINYAGDMSSSNTLTAGEINVDNININSNAITRSGQAQIVMGSTLEIDGFSEIRFEINNDPKWLIGTDGNLLAQGDYGIAASTGNDMDFGVVDSSAAVNLLTRFGGTNHIMARFAEEQIIYNSFSASLPSTYIEIKTGNGLRWAFNGNGSYALFPGVDDAYDIGQSGNRVNNLYLGGQTLSFTGAHVYKVSDTNTPSEGDCVKLVNREMQKCDSDKDPKCIGIITNHIYNFGLDGNGNPMTMKDSFGDSYTYDDLEPSNNPTFASIASLGDSKTSSLVGAKICDSGGAVADGDLLCSSATKPGFLMKQLDGSSNYDNVMRDYTVAQAREDVTFDVNGEATGIYVYILK